MSFYVVLRSTDGSSNYPNNSPHRFRVLLNKPLYFNPQEWTVGLCELYCDKVILSDTPDSKQIPSGSGGELYITCNVCQPSFVGQSERSSLRRVVLHHKRSYLDVTFNPVFYLPVAHSECREILLEISDHLGRPADFIKGPVSVTLHFKQRPFIL